MGQIICFYVNTHVLKSGAGHLVTLKQGYCTYLYSAQQKRIPEPILKVRLQHKQVVDLYMALRSWEPCKEYELKNARGSLSSIAKVHQISRVKVLKFVQNL